MIAKVTSCSVNGVYGYPVVCEVDISHGLPSFDIVGLPDSAVKESKNRVRTAIQNAGFTFPIKRITVNLAPADIKKEGTHFDLPIALGILAADGVIHRAGFSGHFVCGELSLDGEVKGVRGVLPMSYGAMQNGVLNALVPSGNAAEAAIVSGITVFGVGHLQEAIDFFNHEKKIEPTLADIDSLFLSERLEGGMDFSDVRGQESVKRALEIAAAGMHNVIITGPPGSGKTMLAKRLPTILPDLTFDESIDITKIYSVAAMLPEGKCLITKRPFRSPHHSISYSALTGGGRVPKPGEISLAHNGVLFLDELPEFQKKVLENLRQPLEDKEVTISRVNGSITYPANFMLIAAMNPCPCGLKGSSDKCRCSDYEISKYVDKISGALLDRVDINIEAPAVSYDDLDRPSAEGSGTIRKRVSAAHKRQKHRFQNEGILFNNQMNTSQIERYCRIGDKEKEMLKMAFDRLGLSVRSYHRILRVARTIADLASEQDIMQAHIAEAIGYRTLDRKFWY